MAGELARAEVVLEVNFDGLEDDIKRGLEKRVRAAARKAQAELDRAEVAAAALGDTLDKRVGGSAEKATAAIRRAAKTADTELKKAGRSADTVASAVERVAAAAHSAQDALLDIDSGGKFVEIRRQVEAVQESLFDLDTVELDRVEKSSDRAATSLRSRLVNAARQARSGLFDLGERGPRLLSRLGGAASTAGDLVGSAISKGASVAGAALSRLASPKVLALVGLGLVGAINLLPPAAVAAAGTVTGVLGSALVGIGLAASAGSDRAQTEITSLGAFIRSRTRDLAQPFEETWGRIAVAGRKAFKGLEPALRDSLATLAPRVSTFADQLADGLQHLSPALDGITGAFDAILASLGPQLPSIFATISDGITSITSAIERNPQAFVEFVQAMAGLVRVLGQVVGFLYDVGPAVLDAIPGLGLLTDLLSALADHNVDVAASTSAAASANAAAAATYNGLSAEVYGLTGNVQGLASAAYVANSAQLTLNWALRDGTLTGQEYLGMVEQIVGANINAATSQIGFERAIDQAAEAIRRNGATLDINTEKGRRNSESLLAIASSAHQTIAALKDQGAAQSTVNAVADRARAKIEGLARSAGASKKEARELANDILGLGKKVTDLPKEKKIKITAVTSPAQAAVDALIRNINSRSASITVRTKTAGASGGLVVRGLIVPGYEGGGRVRGPGGPRADRVPALLSNGEYVINARATRRYLALLEALNAGRFADGGLVGKASAVLPRFATGGQARGGGRLALEVSLGVTLSAAARRRLTDQLRAIGDRLGGQLTESLIGSPDQIRRTVRDLERQITRAFAGIRTTVDDRLVARLERAGRELATAAKVRDRLAEAIRDAQQFRDQVTDRAARFADITGLRGFSDVPLSVEQITKGLGDRLATLREFERDITTLQKRGLGKSLIRQLVEAGPDQGGQLAAALARASQADLASLRSIQDRIDKTTKRLGTNAADFLYDAGAQAGKGFLAGLKAQQKQIEALMTDIAKSVSATVRKTLKIKSPSRVMERDGMDTMAGYILGVRRLAARARSAVAEAVQPAYQAAARATAPRAGTAGAPAYPSGPREIHHHTNSPTFHIHQAYDPRAVAAQVESRLLNSLR